MVDWLNKRKKGITIPTVTLPAWLKKKLEKHQKNYIWGFNKEDPFSHILPSFLYWWISAISVHSNLLCHFCFPTLSSFTDSYLTISGQSPFCLHSWHHLDAAVNAQMLLNQSRCYSDIKPQFILLLLLMFTSDGSLLTEIIKCIIYIFLYFCLAILWLLRWSHPLGWEPLL